MARRPSKTEQEKSREIASHWKEQIEAEEKDRKRWIDRCERIVKAYRDDRLTTDATPDLNKKLNLFWSNTETLKPAIYSKTPQPIVERRFLDKDPVGKVAAQILERVLRYEIPNSDFHHTMKMVRNDYLLVGRGVPWVRYVPQFGESISIKDRADDELTDNNNEPIEPDAPDAGETVISETVCTDYVQYTDFYILGHPRTWKETEAIAKRAFMSRYDLIEKFGKEIGKEIPLDHSPGDDEQRNVTSKTQDKLGDKATVYEIWCKYEKKVYFIARGYDRVCMEVDDPLHLEGFWPCPRPIFANQTNNTLIPVPDYAEAQDQYIQINELTRRIEVLTDACRVAGVYDAANKEIGRLFSEAKEPQLIAVNSWAVFAERGGLKGQIDFVPIDLIAKTLETLIKVRGQLIIDLDRITGVFDIMRGETDPNETLGAQQLKQQNGFGRISERQEEFARLCRDTICIMGEIIAEHYDPKTLITVSGAMFDEGLVPETQPTPQAPSASPGVPVAGPGGAGLPSPQQPPVQSPMQPPMPPGGQPIMMPPAQPDPMQQKMEIIGKAIELLKNEKLRGFRIDIETDSTIQADAMQEKAAVTEFLGGVTKFIAESAQISQAVPEFVPLSGKMLTWGLRRFRVGRDLETAIEEFVDMASRQAKQRAANPQPNPEQMKAQAEMAKVQGEMAKTKLENEGSMAELGVQMEMKKIDLQLKSIELQMKQLDLELRTREMHTGLIEASMPEEGGEGEGAKPNGNGMSVHPHLALDQIGKAAERIERAAQVFGAPRRIERGPDGKATRMVIEQ